MAAASIQTTNWSWQLRHLGNNLSEWIQFQLSRRGQDSREPPPTFEFPDWVGELLFWVAITVVVIWVALLIVQLIDKYRARRVGQPLGRIATQAITPEPARTAADWVRQARQFERHGNWQEACRAFYLAALQLLNDRDWLPHQLSRTDGEYLQAIQKFKQPRPLQLLIRTHERSHFGGESLTAENLQHCRQAYGEIEKQ